MRFTGRRLTACVLAWGIASPAVASVFAFADGAAEALCAQQAIASDNCRGAAMLVSVADMAGIGLAAQPVRGFTQPARPAPPVSGRGGAEVMIGEIASLSVSHRNPGASPAGPPPVLFWVFGSGLLGAAFVARRRKPALRKAR